MSIVQKITLSLDEKVIGVKKIYLIIGLLAIFLLYLMMGRKEKFETVNSGNLFDNVYKQLSIISSDLPTIIPSMFNGNTQPTPEQSKENNY